MVSSERRFGLTLAPEPMRRDYFLNSLFIGYGRLRDRCLLSFFRG